MKIAHRVDAQDQQQQTKWLQLNVGLVRQNAEALTSARAFFAQIRPLVEQWRSEGLLHCCFLMRKPPDIRLRFLMVADEQQVMTTISQKMLTLENQGFINQFFFSDYQAETERFGGAEAMMCVHNYFDSDTSIWVELDYLSQQGFPVIPPEIFLPTVFNDLFHRARENDFSAIKIWYRLAEFIPALPDCAIPEVEHPVSIERLCSNLANTEVASMIHSYIQANNTLVKQLLRLEQNQRLTCDLIDVLATVAMFNFNRHGFPGSRSGVLIKAVLQKLERRMSGMDFLLSPW